MIKRIKWFMHDAHCSIASLLMKRKISKLKIGDIVLFKDNKKYKFQGINYWGFKDGFLPQYSIQLSGKYEYDYFETPIVNIKII